VVEFLSPEWFDEVNAERQGRSGPSGEVRIGVVVTGRPGGDVAYVLLAGPDGVRLVRGGPEPAGDVDVTLFQDFETAEAIASGRLSARSALLAGRLEVRGDLATLAGSLDVLLSLASPEPGPHG
jgi:SCP-2 sterol transfer family